MTDPAAARTIVEALRFEMLNNSMIGDRREKVVDALDAVLKDARRYAWLRGSGKGAHEDLGGETLDAAIDAAIDAAMEAK